MTGVKLIMSDDARGIISDNITPGQIFSPNTYSKSGGTDSSRKYLEIGISQSINQTSGTKSIKGMFETFTQKPTGTVKHSFYNPFEVKRRKRTTEEQYQTLEAAYLADNKPTANARRLIASQLGMTARAVQVWFQNRRAKNKGKNSCSTSTVSSLSNELKFGNDVLKVANINTKTKSSSQFMSQVNVNIMRRSSMPDLVPGQSISLPFRELQEAIFGANQCKIGSENSFGNRSSTIPIPIETRKNRRMDDSKYTRNLKKQAIKSQNSIYNSDFINSNSFEGVVPTDQQLQESEIFSNNGNVNFGIPTKIAMTGTTYIGDSMMYLRGDLFGSREITSSDNQIIETPQVFGFNHLHSMSNSRSMDSQSMMPIGLSTGCGSINLKASSSHYESRRSPSPQSVLVNDKKKDPNSSINQETRMALMDAMAMKITSNLSSSDLDLFLQSVESNSCLVPLSKVNGNIGEDSNSQQGLMPRINDLFGSSGELSSIIFNNHTQLSKGFDAEALNQADTINFTSTQHNSNQFFNTCTQLS